MLANESYFSSVIKNVETFPKKDLEKKKTNVDNNEINPVTGIKRLLNSRLFLSINISEIQKIDYLNNAERTDSGKPIDSLLMLESSNHTKLNGFTIDIPSLITEKGLIKDDTEQIMKSSTETFPKQEIENKRTNVDNNQICSFDQNNPAMKLLSNSRSVSNR
jgi:hypothetical protein